jgi:hypothetical protein
VHKPCTVAESIADHRMKYCRMVGVVALSIPHRASKFHGVKSGRNCTNER